MEQPEKEMCLTCEEPLEFCTCWVEDTCGVCEEHLDDCECTDEEFKGTYH